MAAVALAWPVQAGWRDAAPDGRLPEPHASTTDLPCVVTASREVHPSLVPIDSEVTITTSVRAECAVDRRRLHIVFVVDAGEHMRDRGRNWLSILIGDLETALRGIDIPATGTVKIGLVSYSEGLAQNEAYLTSDVDTLIFGLHNITIRTGDTPLGGLAKGLSTAFTQLQSGRREVRPASVREVIILGSRGFRPDECDAVRTAGGEVKAGGILLVTACGGGECERRCLREVATAPQYAFASNAWGYLALLLGQVVGSTGTFHPLDEVRVFDELSESLAYTGGGDPSAGEGNALTWTFRPWPVGGITRTYRARAVDFGRFPISRRARVDLSYDPTYGSGITQTVALPNPWLEVLPVPATHTPTPDPDVVPPSATPAASPGPTVGDVTPTAPTATAPSPTAPLATAPSATATATATPSVTVAIPETRVRTAWLPIAVARGCMGSDMPLDVAVVIDVSGSMQVADVDPFLSRWHAAQVVATTLVADHLAARDRVAVLPFGETAEVRAGLDDGRDQALAALAALPRWNGSRIDLAIDLARSVLVAGRSTGAGRQAKMVILTDGDLNQTERPSLAGRAGAARAAGIDLYVIALGRDADRAALAAVAGTSEYLLSSSDIGILGLAGAIGPHLRCRR